jgi:hypothetical protein
VRPNCLDLSGEAALTVLIFNRFVANAATHNSF